MDTKNVKKNLYKLAMLAETDSPVVSCYLNLEKGLIPAKLRLERRQRELLRMHKGKEARSIELAFKRIEAWLEEHLDSRSKGAAVFVCCGSGDFLMGLQFFLPLPDVCIVDAVPNVYHLVEMKDTYHRYVILLATAEGSRILTVNYGTVSERVWREFPEARERISKEWSREHYRSHLRDRRDRVLKEQVATLEELIREEGFDHLLLAGNPSYCATIREALPKRLQKALVERVDVSGNETLGAIMRVAVLAFIAQENEESRDAVAALCRRLHTDGLVCMGAEASLDALRNGQAEKLVLAQDFSDLALREELVRHATKTGATIELVRDSNLLRDFGGVGCMLRYLLPGQWTGYVHDSDNAREQDGTNGADAVMVRVS